MKYTKYCRESMLCRLFTTWSQNSVCRLLQGVTHEIYQILQGVDAPSVAYYAELKLSMLFTMGIHCYFRGVNHENLEDSPSL